MRLPAKTLAAAWGLSLAVALAGCGAKEEPGREGHEPAREGLAVELAGVEYNVFITRQLNPDVPPDDAYYEGPQPRKGQTFYGVFLQACNAEKEPRRTASDFLVVDSQGNEFEPKELPETNKFAYHPTLLDPDECVPSSGSVAQLGPTAGAMLLFELPLTATENRPLELEVRGVAGAHEKLSFELDL